MTNKIYHIIIILTAILFGVAAFTFYPTVPIGDESRYDVLAASLVRDQAYITVDNDDLLAPGYPLLLTAVYSLFGIGNYTAAYVVNAICLAVIGLAVFRIATKQLDLKPWQGLIASLVTVSWPYLLLYTKLIMSELFYIAVLTWLTYWLIELYRAPKVRTALIAGALLGAATLIRPVPILLPFWLIGFTIALFLWRLWRADSFACPPRHVKVAGVIAIGTFLLVIVPWIGYASMRKQTFVPIATTAVGVYHGANTSYLSEWSHYKTPGYEPGQPITWQKMALIKVKNFFRFWRSGANGYQLENLAERYPLVQNGLVLFRFYHYLVIALVIASLYFVNHRAVAILWCIIIYIWMFHTMLHTQPRFTLPAMPLAIILASFTLFKIVDIFKIKYVINPK